MVSKFLLRVGLLNSQHHQARPNQSIIQSTTNSRKIHASHKFLDPIQNCASESSSLLETEYLGALVYQ